jgi:hypothetical protein
MISGCGPDLPNHGIEHLRFVKAYPGNGCIEMYYDLDDDKKVDVIEVRRWNPQKGVISDPFIAMWDRDKNLDFSQDEGYQIEDPMPGGPPCPPCKNKGKDSTL